MGAEAEIRKHSTKEKGMQWVNGQGKPFATLGATGRTDVQSITSEFEIFRGELGKIFIEPSLDKIHLVFDESIDHYEERSEGVTVHFKNGKPASTYDLLVAADGFGSRIRGTMLGTNPREQIHDEGVHVAYFTIKKDLLKGSQYAQWHNELGGRVVCLRPDPSPKGQVRAMLINITTKSQTAEKARLNQALTEGNESYMALMEEMFKDAGWLAPEVLKGMRKSDDFYCSLFAQTRSPKLQNGQRVVLLGDAGYATPGMGTSLAIMGAYVLAGELLRNDCKIPRAMQEYENLLHPFVKSQQGGAIGEIAMQLLNPQTRWGCWIRDLVMMTLTGLKIDQIAITLSAWLGFTEPKLPMPEYAWPAVKS
ncbi:hypothetical protein LTR78_005903 [Recurvomyces mirabilis]|uniref:FAD-binding domain-containing protein n=1 Tax=Recurvomyces mirabilis TaxID=574656 RepID=A0AAE0WLS3_9PEZI|nr:hypothetical protein LTR78_005903 [Recurvomyces mirabilis]KAK5155288.1 hypothetical protein LTS14_006243 [Recurvomyces mirabilis]